MKKFYFVFVLLIWLFIFCLLTGCDKEDAHFMYDHIPVVKIDNKETSYYKISSKYEKQGRDYSKINYPNVLPINSSEIKTMCSIDKKDSMILETEIACEYHIKYYYIDEEYNAINSSDSWISIDTYDIAHIDYDNNVVYFDNINFDNNIVIFIVCEYQDLTVSYYYVINK